MTEQIQIELRSGGTVTLSVEAEWLWLNVDEFQLLRDLADLMHTHAADNIEPAPPSEVVIKLPTARTPRKKAAKKTTAKPKPTLVATPRGKHAAVDYDEVARVYTIAITAGRKPIQALADHFEVEHSTAKNWPARCRELGLLPPLGTPLREPDPPPKPKPVAVTVTSQPHADASNAFTTGDATDLLERRP